MPVTIVIYSFLPKNTKQTAFILFSVIFFVISDIVSAVGIIFAAIIAVTYARISQNIRKHNILFLILTYVIMLIYICSLIGFSIYNSIRLENAHSLLRFCPFVTSFFFVQLIRFIFDIYKGKIQIDLSVKNSLDYLMFYPRLVMGPVMTYDEHIAMLADAVNSSEGIGEGLTIFIKGLSKKLLIADTIGMVFFPLYGVMDSSATLLMSWLTVLAFALEFYFTLAGFGDMAKGIALCYGFNIPESYKYPLLSGSLSKFGNEWNISVVSWIRSCFAPMLRNNKWQSIIGMTAAWLILGVWYRPQLHILIWGAWIGFWIGLDGYMRNKWRRIPNVINGILFFITTFFGWAFFMSESLSDGVKRIGFLLGSSAVIASSQDLYYLSSAGIILLIAVYGATGNFSAILERMRSNTLLSKLIGFTIFFVQLLLFFLCIIVIITNNDIAALQIKGAV